MDPPWERLRRNMSTIPGHKNGAMDPPSHGVLAISNLSLFLHQRPSQSEPMRRFWLHFPVGLHHCANVTTHVQSTVIVGLILRLGPRDGEGGFVPRDGAREAIRDPRGAAVCAVDEQAWRLSWGLLVPARVVTTRDGPRASATGECDCPSWRYGLGWLLGHHSLRIHP